ncbi:hypothetical protein HMPREF0322_05030 [Desulfitobacterium hafniense DP7]|uniref:Uncharacterized protein n=1 Tax=Desulfitobacterium hafniense DP7 TaxID=537010 RepID=G9XW46_DESHA|nr:hypothetical protein HMPREF0322_05030 [Desulfitobacterium hafniense DP7]
MNPLTFELCSQAVKERKSCTFRVFFDMNAFDGYNKLYYH